MAAIDLPRGLEHRGQSWGTERAELTDSFDLEMQEWEVQLQDMQMKIEELYNEVQARRGGNDITSEKNSNDLNFGPQHQGNGFCDPPGCHSYGNKDRAVGSPNLHSNGYNYATNGCSYPVNHQNRSTGYAHSSGVAEFGDLLQDYLGQGHGMTRKNSGAPITHGKQMAKVSWNLPGDQNEVNRKPANERVVQDRIMVGFEEAENRKNKHCNKENTGAKPPFRQRDAPPVPPRSTSQLPDSPAPDRKVHNSGVLVDRKCGSPSVLRKFGAMLQENEGKTFTDTGVLTNLVPQEPRCPTPACQRRSLGAGRTPTRGPVQKFQADSSVLTAEMDPIQDWAAAGPVIDSRKQSYVAEQRGTSLASYGHPKGPQHGAQPQRRTQVGGSPKARPRASSAGDRDLVHGQRVKRPAPQPVEPRVEYRNLGGSPGSQRIQRGGMVGKDGGLVELLDMLDIEHEYNPSPRASAALSPYRQEMQQATPPQSSPATPRRNFCRPARPANQRPPSRWASCTPTSKISAPCGPMSRPPSPLARPPSPMTRSPSPALKQQSFSSYLLHAETVIM
ncbi:actin cytoskeleton-regulatory complex protein pan1-like [Hypomesus transpacificus]|uniref:actin cytoskeleton-regulatory complex protein pan1-like n=1 Tax=Hypomesus transpacificus TaxID=137520 RepID=UPI001F0795D2|nr:actin cytoskeleton-regulatory complex protein pan1-like [Hypomesus transpacificus]